MVQLIGSRFAQSSVSAWQSSTQTLGHTAPTRIPRPRLPSPVSVTALGTRHLALGTWHTNLNGESELRTQNTKIWAGFRWTSRSSTISFACFLIVAQSLLGTIHTVGLDSNPDAPQKYRTQPTSYQSKVQSATNFISPVRVIW